MAKVRVHELAKELGVESKVVLTKLKEMGEFVKSASSTVEPPVVKRFTDQFGAELKASADQGAAKKAAAKPAPEGARQGRRGAQPLPPRAGSGRRDPGGGRRRGPRRAATGPRPGPRPGPAEQVRRASPLRRSRSPRRPRPGPDRGAPGPGRRERRAPRRPIVPVRRPRVRRPVPALRVPATTRSPRPRAWAVVPLPARRATRPPSVRTVPRVRRPVATAVRPVAPVACPPVVARSSRHAPSQPRDDAQVPGRLRWRTRRRTSRSRRPWRCARSRRTRRRRPSRRSGARWRARWRRSPRWLRRSSRRRWPSRWRSSRPARSDPGCVRSPRRSVASWSQVEARASSRVRADAGPDDRWRARPQGRRRDHPPGARLVADRLRREDRRRRGVARADAVQPRRDGHGDRVGQRRDAGAARRRAELRHPGRLARGRGPRAAGVLRPRVR